MGRVFWTETLKLRFSVTGHDSVAAPPSAKRLPDKRWTFEKISVGSPRTTAGVPSPSKRFCVRQTVRRFIRRFCRKGSAGLINVSDVLGRHESACLSVVRHRRRSTPADPRTCLWIDFHEGRRTRFVSVARPRDPGDENKLRPAPLGPVVAIG